MASYVDETCFALSKKMLFRYQKFDFEAFQDVGINRSNFQRKSSVVKIYFANNSIDMYGQQKEDFKDIFDFAYKFFDRFT